MWDFDHNTLPPSLAIQFPRRNTHQTRMVSSGEIEIKSTNTNKYGAKSFKTYGAIMLNQLMNNETYSDSRTKQIIQNKLKMHFLEKY